MVGSLYKANVFKQNIELVVRFNWTVSICCLSVKLIMSLTQKRCLFVGE